MSITNIAYANDLFIVPVLGVNRDSSFADALKAAIRTARQDALGQGAFYSIADMATISGNSNPTSKEKANFHEECECEIFGRIQNLVDQPHENPYPDWFLGTCRSLVESYSSIRIKPLLIESSRERADSGKAFTFGNAQKWISMTMKYLLFFAHLCKDREASDEDDFPWQNILALKDTLYAPIDNYVLKALFENGKEGKGRSSKNANSSFSVKREGPYSYFIARDEATAQGHTAPQKLYRWSQMDESTFMAISEAIADLAKEKDKAPIEWENSIWVKTACKRARERYDSPIGKCDKGSGSTSQ